MRRMHSRIMADGTWLMAGVIARSVPRLAWVLTLSAILVVPAGPTAQQKPDVALRAAMETETVKGDLKSAIEQYKQLAQISDRAIAAQALLRLAAAYQKLGDSQAKSVYERLVRDYGDQKETAAEARARLGAMSAAMRQPSGTGVDAIQLWDSTDIEGDAALSPDGRYLAFSSWSESGNLVVKDLATGLFAVSQKMPGFAQMAA